MAGRTDTRKDQRTVTPLWEQPVDAERFARTQLAHQTEQWPDAERMAREVLADAIRQARGQNEGTGQRKQAGSRSDQPIVSDTGCLDQAGRVVAVRNPTVQKKCGDTLLMPACFVDRGEPCILHVSRLIADTLYMTHRLSECLAYLVEAMREGTMPLDDTYADLLRGWIYRRNNQVNTANELARAQLRRGGDDMALEIRASFLHLQADCESQKGKSQQAQRKLRDAVALSRTSGSLEIQALTLNALGVNELAFSRIPLARRHFEEALRLYERLGKSERRAQVLMNLAVLYTKSGWPEQAVKLLAESPEVHGLIARPRRRLLIRMARAKALLDMDQVQRARKEARPVLGLAIKGCFPRVEVLALEVLGDCALAEGRVQQAKRYYNSGLEVCSHKVPGYQAAGADLACGLYRRLGQSHLVDGEWKQAVKRLRRAVQLARGCRERYEEGIAGRLLARAYARMDLHGQAAEQCGQAQDVLRDMGAELQLAHALLEAARIHLAWWQQEPHRQLERALSCAVEAEQWYGRLEREQKVIACRELVEEILAARVEPWSGTSLTLAAGPALVREMKTTGADADHNDECSRSVSAGLTKKVVSPVTFIAEAPATKRLLSLVEIAAASNEPVLITGETGTGKELIAQLVHKQSQRQTGPWVAVNCAAIPGTLFEREVFGHSAGAFTGAVHDRPGLCEKADGGTLFLDEVGDVALPLQVKLLRLLQEGSFRRLGDPEERQVDLRLVAATNADLHDRIARDEFRRDLFYRLRVFDLRVPPLRERREDVEPLIRYFIKEQLSDEARPDILFDAAVRVALQHYEWPGNVRELQGVIKRLILLAMHEGRATVAMLPPEIMRGGGGMAKGEAAEWAPLVKDENLNLAQHLEKAERSRIVHALSRAGGNRTTAARLLGISRNTLYKKLQRLGIVIPSW
jgi:DNA-binding NtrC family response regulator/tetratricopeptide (TPR) repeat protein